MKVTPTLPLPENFVINEIRILGKKGIIKKFKTIKGFNSYINRESKRIDDIPKIKLEWRGLQMF